MARLKPRPFKTRTKAALPKTKKAALSKQGQKPSFQGNIKTGLPKTKKVALSRQDRIGTDGEVRTLRSGASTVLTATKEKSQKLDEGVPRASD
jgi:hypothetical protein